MSLFKKKKSHGVVIAGADKKTLHENLDFTSMEQYKLLRTNLEFVLPGNEKCPVIGITSSIRGEAKSTTAINLAYVLAQKGHRVLLIDGDLRLPSLAKKLDITGSFGLTDLLRGRKVNMEDAKSELLENLYILLAGEIPPNPSELLGSPRMEAVLNGLRESFDYIIIDLPPVNIVSDALAISGLITGMVIVIREDYTEKKELQNCFRQLKLSNVNVLGCVLNEAKAGKGAYGKYKKYYKNSKYKYYQYYTSNH